MSKQGIRQRFTKWYVKHGYSYYNDFEVIEDPSVRYPYKIGKPHYDCPWWVKPLLIFFSPSVYFAEIFEISVINRLLSFGKKEDEDDVS